MAHPLIVLVGHCRPDTSHLTMAVRKAVPEAMVKAVWNPAELDGVLQNRPADAPPPLLLVNRVLEPGFPTHSGLDLIQQLRSSYPQVRLMLVSNYADAQAEATAAGAYPGFGKNDLMSPKLSRCLHDALK